MSKQYCIGLDISTKTIGITLVDTSGNLIDISHISFPKTSKKNGVITIYHKADFFRVTIEEYLKDYPLAHIFIEEPLKNGPNIGTTILLAKFNGIVSQIMWEVFKVIPQHISVHDSRKTFFPEFIKTETTKKKKTGLIETKETLSFPEGDKKQHVFDKVAWLEPHIKWVYNKLGILETENYDRADSYVVTKAGLVLNKYIDSVPQYLKLAS